MSEPNIQLANSIAKAKAETISPDGNITTTQLPQPDLSIVKEPEIKEEQPKIEEKSEDTSLFDAFLESKGEVIKEEKTVEKPTIADKQIEQPKIETRDYSDLDEDEIEMFKKMGNIAFNKFKPAYIEYKKIKSELPKKEEEIKKLKEQNIPSVYQHEEGFVLDPEFRKVYQDATQTEQIAEHWYHQLQKIQQGASEIEDLRLNPQTNVLEKFKVQATPDIEPAVLKQFTMFQQAAVQKRANVNNVIAYHKTRYSEGANAISNMENTFFSKLNSPENKDTYVPLINQQLETFPPSMRSHPLASLAAKSLVMNAALAKLLTKAAATVEKPKIERQVAGPSKGEATADGGNEKTEKTFSIDDFEKVKGGY